MGFDITGIKPKKEVGEYFHNNCWYWRPLWDFCKEVAPKIIDDKLHKAGHYNDGEIINSDDAHVLGCLLFGSLENGCADKYKGKYQVKSHIFEIENLFQFAVFCINSGGFEIC